MVTILVNPSARSGDIPAVTTRIGEAFATAGLEHTIVTAQGPEVSDAARRAIAAGSGIVVAAGGDGTVSAVATVVACSTAVLGVVPLGTLNHFARDMGIPMDLPSAARAIALGRVKRIDVADVNGRTFINNSSIGLYPRLVWEREQEERMGRGKWTALGVASLRVWRRYRRLTVAIADGDSREPLPSRAQVVRTPFVFVGNNQYELEAWKVGARHRLDGGRLHVCTAPDLERSDVLGFAVSAVLGRLHASERFESVLTSELSIDGPDPHVGISLDGEIVGLDCPLRYHVRPLALQVLVP